ncbi:MAG TPA: hypothetical protein VGA09_00360 [Candidatus Binatia bacterium]
MKTRETRRRKNIAPAASLDSPAAKSERELLKRVQAINRYVEEQNGERPVVAALAYQLRLNAQMVRHSANSCASATGSMRRSGASLTWVEDQSTKSSPIISGVSHGPALRKAAVSG